MQLEPGKCKCYRTARQKVLGSAERWSIYSLPPTFSSSPRVYNILEPITVMSISVTMFPDVSHVYHIVPHDMRSDTVSLRVYEGA